MKKKKYITPETVVIHVPTEHALLVESGGTIGGEKIPVEEGDLGDHEEGAAKRHNSLWDEDESFNSWK